MPSNLLLLDEPTNHLDIPAREAIEAFMTESPATLLLVSHDRRLLETVCTSLWVVDAGLAAPFDGGYREWRTAVTNGWTVAGAIEQRRASRAGVGAAERTSRPGGGAGATGRSSGAAGVAGGVAIAPTKTASRPARREKLSKDAYRRQKAQLDAELSRLGLRRSHLELAIGDPSVSANFVEMRRISSELADVQQALAAAEDAWLDLEDRAP